MDYQQIINDMENRRIRAESDAQEQLDTLILTLRNRSIEKVEINFDGAGDDGSIHEINLYPKEIDGENLRGEIEDWGYKFLEGTGVDWYNNEGGFGEIIINIKDNKFNYEVNQRVESYEQAAWGERDIR